MSTHSPLVDATTAASLLRDGAARAIDCRFDLGDTGKGEREYAAGHLPGAIYAHLDRDLSDALQTGRGRHPLPRAADFTATLSRWGLTRDTLVIAYDDNNSAHAARLWWMLRLLGHENVRVLDGGIRAWLALGLPVETTVAAVEPTAYDARYDEGAIATTPEVDAHREDDGWLLLDARAAPRFRGEVEPIDPVAGHVPGARNRPFADNLEADGRFKSPAALRDAFAPLLGEREPQRVLLMCGSGVTACHNLLALEHAGWSGARVYAGSWSEWINDPKRPVARGD
jgi:thiosulfate/3-mercaptopyruvate sulfurtransferase